MIPFAVTIEGVTQANEALWVLAVSGNKVLVSKSDRRLEWHSLEKCRFAKLVSPELGSPDMPMVVIVAQPQIQLAKPGQGF